MKIESEKDIPALRGKTWKQRAELRRQAQRNDPAILWLWVVNVMLQIPILALSRWLLGWLALQPPFWAVSCLFLGLGFPVAWLFHGFFIVPRVRKALKQDGT